MQKGKFGFFLWVYPLIGLLAVVVGPSLASIVIFGFVLAVERDEWATRQCMHVVLLDLFWGFYKLILGFLRDIPFLNGISYFSLALSIIDLLAIATLVVLVLVMGVSNIMKGRNIGLPGAGLVARAYGMVRNVAPPQYGGQPYNAQNYQPGAYAGPQGAPPSGQYPPYQPGAYPPAQAQPVQAPAAGAPPADSGNLKPPPPPPPAN